ncbi:MAG: hypothetical protein IJ086_00180 [Clostridium sp.]|nr:hypothetical protein [Clostridium sp.]
MKYKTPYIIIGILVLLLMYFSIFCKPNINFSTKINNISTLDYQNILDINQIILEENKDIDKFKYLYVNVKIKAPYILVKNVKISTPGLEQYLDDNNIIILGTGGVDAYMEKTEQVLVYLNNVDEKSLKNILKDFKYVIQWSNICNKIDKVNC